jgi:predicted DNA-binding transcriptional regulator YafY
VSVAGPVPTVDPDTLAHIAAAIRDSERLRFDYLNHDGTASRRSAQPHRLVFTGRRWYLLAWNDDRDDWRTFRADRIRPRVPNGPRFTPASRPAKVRLYAPAATLAEQLHRAAGLLRPDGEDACILETGSDSPYDLAAFLGSLEVPFTVLEPPELRQLLATLAGRYQAAAGDPEA